MQIGIHLPQYGRVASPEAVSRAARHAEQLGYAGVWVSDHIVQPAAQDYPSPYLYDPLVTLTWAAAVTDEIGLGTSVLVVPQHHPLELANSLASLDDLSGGRLTVGVGVGWSAAEFDALDQDFSTRGARIDEALRIWRAVWDQDPATFHGEHYDFEDLLVEPHAVHEDVPLWVGGRSRRSLGRAVALADGWAPFGLKRGAFADWIREADVPDGFEVVAQPGARVDPSAEPARVDDLLGEWAEAGATVVDLHLVHHSVEHLLEQLHALAP